MVMILPKRRAAVIAGLALLGVAFAGCGGGDADEEAIEEVLRGVAEASSNADAAAYAAYFTDEGLMDDVGMTRDELLTADPDDWANPLRLESIADIDIKGATATVDATFVAMDSFVARIAPTLVKIDGSWKFNESPGNELLPPVIPKGVTPVGISMSDFAFGFDGAAPGAGTRAFAFTNNAGQDHEAVMFAVTDPELDVMAALEAEEESGALEFRGFAYAKAGSSTNLLFANSLAAGRYALVCFLPDVNDAAETPHAFKGMVTEFVIP